jgi:hypothetical protein
LWIKGILLRHTFGISFSVFSVIYAWRLEPITHIVCTASCSALQKPTLFAECHGHGFPFLGNPFCSALQEAVHTIWVIGSNLQAYITENTEKDMPNVCLSRIPLIHNF